MSLTSHLRDAASPVRQFVYACAPDLAIAGTRGVAGAAMAAHFGFDDLTSLETQIPVPAEVKPGQRRSHAAEAGTALDYRIRMDLPGFDVTHTIAWRGLSQLEMNLDLVHRGKHLHTLLRETLDFAFLTLKEKAPHPLSVARVSVPLAWCEAIYRAGPSALQGSLGRRIKRAKDSVELMMSIEDHLVLDIAQMHHPLTPLLDEWKDAIAGGSFFAPNPHLVAGQAIGGADADLAIDDVLVEVKTREEITNPWLRDTLLQLLGYALLDIDDSLGIRRVAILLPRQPDIAIWELDDILGREAEAALPDLRVEFAELLSAMLSEEPDD